MRNIIYYVASSLDGFIAGEGGDISMFKMDGEGVEQYQYDLEDFDTVIMGRKTYEFGYAYGLKPGQPAYVKMEHHIFSNTLELNSRSGLVNIQPLELEVVNELKEGRGSDIYLCGGGAFAGWLMKYGLIDTVKLKVNPVLIGSGIPLFGNESIKSKLSLSHHQKYEDGMQIVTYDVINS